MNIQIYIMCVKEISMYNPNIANYILYSLAHEKVENGLGVNSGLISDVVEGWNRQIYVVPNKKIKFHTQNKKYKLM